MNKKTFTVAVIFLIVTLVWLGVNIFWALSNKNCIFDLIVAVLFALAGAGMVYNRMPQAQVQAPRRGEQAPDSLTGRFTVVSERGDRVFRQGDAAVLWRMARGKEDDRCARVRAAVCAAVLRAVLYAGPCGAAVAEAGARSRKRVK